MKQARWCRPIVSVFGSWRAEGLAVRSYSLLTGEFTAWLDCRRSYLEQNKILLSFLPPWPLLSCDMTRLFFPLWPIKNKTTSYPLVLLTQHIICTVTVFLLLRIYFHTCVPVGPHQSWISGLVLPSFSIRQIRVAFPSSSGHWLPLTVGVLVCGIVIFSITS